MKTIYAFLATLSISPLVLGTTVYQSSIDELYKESSLVVFGQVEEGRIIPENCGVQYAVRVTEIYKGEVKSGELIWFKKYGPMKVGANYFLFMNNQENEFEPIASTNSIAEAQKEEGIARCKKHFPAYTVNVWGQGAFTSTYTSSAKVPKAVFFDDFMFSAPKELEVITVKQTERYDNDQRYTALNLEKFETYLKKLGKLK